MALPPDEVTAMERKTVGEFPNTYTFTKSLGERLL